jgi:DNA adenine methylase
MSIPHAAPFIKWAGGKTQLLAQLAPYWPDRAAVQRYVEPFLGGGAVFFHLGWQPAWLADRNEALITVYRMVREAPAALMAALDAHQPYVQDATYYYALRAQDPADLPDDIARAARFIYLNRTCYNGLWRVNRRGAFNVPMGRYTQPPRLYNPATIQAAAALLEGATLESGDYRAVLAACGPGDFVYLDPPYHPVSATARFTSYTNFAWDAAEQEALADASAAAAARGALLLINNSDTPLIEALYRERGFIIRRARANRAINSRTDGRTGASELTICNYPPKVL